MTITTPAIDYDPVRAEIIRNRLAMAAEEMASTMVRTSGSPVLTEAKDFSAVIFDRSLEHVGFAGYVIIHVGSSLEGVRAVAEEYGDDIHPYDAFVVNDVYNGGALHQGDVGIVSPLFWEDEHVGWSFANAHLMDIGGMSPGGFAPVAFDVYGEALRFPAIRIVKEGVWVKDIERLLVNNVRVPIVLSDLKSLTAANHTAQNRVTAILDSFGLEEYERYNEINKDLSDKLVRSRIEALPDGVYEAVDWVEYDAYGRDALQEIRIKMIVNGAEIVFDMSDVSEQSPGPSNTGYGAVAGFVSTLLIFFLAWDAPLNAGLWRSVKIEMPDGGTILNPELPAPTSCGHLESGSKMNRCLWEAISKACALSDSAELKGRVQGVGGNAFGGNSWACNTTDGSYSAFTLMDAVSVGGGAHVDADGLDISSYECSLDNGIPDIEINEGVYPILYLWRRINADSSGPGRTRGGQGLDWAWIPHGSKNLTGTFQNAMAMIPSRGILGGFPGGTNRFEIGEEAGVEEQLEAGTIPQDLSSAANVVIPPNHVAGVSLPPGAIFRTLTGGGSGIGDPLLRDPAAVETDVLAGYISTKAAERIYGVHFDGEGVVDAKATERARAEIRRERLGADPEKSIEPEGHFVAALKVSDGSLHCGHCDTDIAPTSHNWKEAVPHKTHEMGSRLGEFDVVIQQWSKTKLTLHEWFCPGCGSTLETNLYPEGMEPIHDLHIGTGVDEALKAAGGAREV